MRLHVFWGGGCCWHQPSFQSPGHPDSMVQVNGKGKFVKIVWQKSRKHMGHVSKPVSGLTVIIMAATVDLGWGTKWTLFE